MKYEPTFESLHQHPVPDWFHDAKLGIFVHWGAYSVPGWALRNETSIFAEAAEKGWEYVYARNQYAEWYLNTVSIEGSPTQVMIACEGLRNTPARQPRKVMGLDDHKRPCRFTFLCVRQPD